MKSNKSVFAAILMLSLCWANVSRAEYGVGIDVTSAGSEIYFPIDLDSHWRIEPSIYYSESETRESNYFRYEGVFYTRVSMGVFRMFEESNHFQPYAGIRVRYGDGRWKSIYGEEGEGATGKYKTREYLPTLGMEYRFGKNFSLSGEVAYSVRDHEKTHSDYSYESKNQNTLTNFLARYMF